jgi:hypothetical protein
LSEPLCLCCFLFLLLAKVSPGVILQLLNVLTMEGWIDVFVQVSLVSGFVWLNEGLDSGNSTELSL